MPRVQCIVHIVCWIRTSMSANGSKGLVATEMSYRVFTSSGIGAILTLIYWESNSTSR